MSVALDSTRLEEAGVYAKHGVVWNDTMRSYAREVRRRLGFDVVITSGVRTPRAQAAALAQDLAFHIYTQRDLVDELKAGGVSAAQMEATLISQVARGRYLSRHMRGDALDFRVRGYTPAERRALVSTMTAVGGKVIDEGDHIHVERLSGVFGQAVEVVTEVAATVVQAPVMAVAAVQEFRRTRPWVAPVVLSLAGLGVTVLVLVLGLRRR